jgi:type I restriction enzyme M protein
MTGQPPDPLVLVVASDHLLFAPLNRLNGLNGLFNEHMFVYHRHRYEARVNADQAVGRDVVMSERKKGAEVLERTQEATDEASRGSSLANGSVQKSLESWIWDAACSIRGAQDAPKYKDFILPLVFAKRLCDVFDDELNRIAVEVGSRSKAFSLVKHDKKLVRFYLPLEPDDLEQPVWSAIRTISDKIGEQLTTRLRSIADANPPLKGIIDRVDFNATTHGQRDIDDDRLSNLIEKISAKRLGLQDVEADIIGRSYEYLIRKFAEGSGQSAGEFYTPPEVGVVMARIMDTQPGMDVYDPCCGSAGLLIKCRLAHEGRSADEEADRSSSSIRLYGQESEAGTWAMASMNMIIHDMDGEIELGDSFRNPKFRSKKGLRQFDRIVANPMWNQDWFTEEEYESDNFDRFSFGTPPNSTADWGWVQHMLASVKSNGRIAVVLDTAAVSRGSGAKNQSRERDIRKKIVEAGLVSAVILLPENLFYNTGAPGIILVLDKTRAPKDPVRLVNASRHFTKGQPKNFLAPHHIDQIVGAAESTEDTEDLCRVVTLDVLRDIDFDLSPARHVPLDPDIPTVPLVQSLAAADATQSRLSKTHTEASQLLTRFSELKPNHRTLPAGWEQTSLAALVADKLSGDWGDEHPTPNKASLRCAVIRGTDFPNVARLRFADVPVRYISEASVEKRTPQVGDILVEISGGGKYQNTGRALFLTNETFAAANDPVMFTNFTKLLRVDSNRILPKYFFYHWSLVYDLGRTARYEKQPTNIKNFKLEDFLKSEWIVFPQDLTEQERIVTALDAVHAELRAVEEARNQVLSVRHAALRELLDGSRRASSERT